MKFCFVSEVFPHRKGEKLVIPGGGEAHAFFLSRELVKRGHGVKMVTGRWRGTPEHEVIDGIEFIRYGSYSPWFDEPIAVSLKNMAVNTVSCVRALNRILKAKKPDFLVTPMSFAFPRVFVLARAHKIPLIAEVHDVYEIPLYLHHYRRDYGPLVYPGLFYVWLYNNLPRYADLVETVSVQNIEPMVRSYGIARERIFVTGNGIEIEKYKYSKEKQQTIAVLGRLVSYKRVDMAIEIFRRVKEKVPDVKLVIVGDGPDRRRLMELAKDKGIKFRGFVAEQEKLRVLQRAKVLLSCSEFEGFGIVPIEALACGAFPVVSDIPAHREVVGKRGFLFRDASEATREICNLLSEEEKRRKLAEKGREYVEATYTWPKVCDRFIQMVEKFDKG
ncbi:MAG: glycosyltransferase family 4 protein [Candidatus Hodarchaeaceae archaeon]|nr:glycosyltransferase family 4 protein [Candidatus Hodarchaeaceae archaeon]